MNIEQQSDWIQEIKEGNQDTFKNLYSLYRDKFMGWCFKQKDMDTDMASELYQLSMVIFYNNIIQGKIEDVSNDLSQYIIQIGKFKFYELLRKKQKVIHSVNDYLYRHEEDDEIERKKEKELKIDRMTKAVELLGDSCQKIIRAFYYLKMSMEDIANKYDFKNANTVKNMKYKCVKQLQKKYYQID